MNQTRLNKAIETKEVLTLGNDEVRAYKPDNTNIVHLQTTDEKRTLTIDPKSKRIYEGELMLKFHRRDLQAIDSPPITDPQQIGLNAKQRRELAQNKRRQAEESSIKAAMNRFI